MLVRHLKYKMKFCIFTILKGINNIYLFIAKLTCVFFLAILKSLLLYKFNINAIVHYQL